MAATWRTLAAVKYMATMEIVGWAMLDSLKKRLAIDAMRMAVQNRRPAPGLVCHSDRGVHYASGAYRKILAAYRAKASMSGKGNCLEFKLVRASGSNGPGDCLKVQNTPMESFFGSLKTEMVHRAHFRSRREAKAALFECIAIFYNRQRRHSRIGYRTPVQARIDMTRAAAA